jgi:hypothetical protein
MEIDDPCNEEAVRYNAFVSMCYNIINIPGMHRNWIKDWVSTDVPPTEFLAADILQCHLRDCSVDWSRYKKLRNNEFIPTEIGERAGQCTSY